MPAHKHTPRPSYVQAPPDQRLFDFEARDLKRCKRCGESKPLDDFYRQPGGRDGRQAACKRCRVELYGKPDQKERLGLKEKGLKQCGGCGEVKPFDAFGSLTGPCGSVRNRCIECRNREWKEVQAADPEKFKAISKAWAQRNKAVLAQRAKERYRKDPAKSRERSRANYARNRAYYIAAAKAQRARRRAAPRLKFTAAQLTQKMAFWGHRCWMCGATADTIDHVKPLVKGGWHALINIRPACRSCNSSKSAEWPLPKERLLKRY